MILGPIIHSTIELGFQDISLRFWAWFTSASSSSIGGAKPEPRGVEGLRLGVWLFGSVVLFKLSL